MKRALLVAIKSAMAVTYGALKLFTRVDRSKVIFLSRRMNSQPLDFQLLQAELSRRRPDLRLVSICHFYTNGLRQTLEFLPALLASVYHLATSRICVVDSYWPAVSALHHRKELTVYQIWHSLGKIKQTGLQTLDRQQGHSSVMADVMKMHQGYDFVVAGSEIWHEQYELAFNVGSEQILHYGLPRADYLYNEQDTVARRIRAAHPELVGRKVLLYAPTFRRGVKPDGAVRLAAALPQDQVLIIKAHKSDHLVLPETGAYLTCPDFTATDLLTVADHLVTDYSSLALEAAIVNLPTLYYLYDEDSYVTENGLNLDLRQEMPGCVFTEAEEVADALERPYPMHLLDAYRKKFLGFDVGHCTDHLVDHMLERVAA